jgi:DNA mismatch repair protein MutL
MPIRVLPPEIANRIAAGEVIERPASVIKELVENAIDAGASDIQIEIQEGGRRLMRVSDDGIGIPAAEAELAFERHATSKLRQVEDLEHISTLGFRGEALASIAAVARVSLSTRAAGEDVGTLIEMDAGRPARRQSIGRPRGTSVTVENLFHNVPARLKFLRAPATEAGHISETVTFYALAYPHLRFRLVSNGRMLFRSDGSGDLRAVLVQAFGLDLVQRLLALEPAEADAAPAAFRLAGFVGEPSLHRPDRNQMIFFVNGRWVRDRNLSYAVIQAYHTWLPAGRYPVAILMLEMEPADVDVNVHPTKAEVRFREPGRIFALVQRQVRATLVQHASVPAATLWQSEAQRRAEQGAGWDWSRRQKLVEAGHATTRPLLSDEDAAGAVPSAAGRLPPLRVLGQVRQMYIVAEGPEGLYLIDQHAAHERVLYERLGRERASQQPASQQLLEPLVVAPTGRQAGLLSEHLVALNRIGFDLEPFGAEAFLMRAVPASLGLVDDPLMVMADILDELEHGEAPLGREEDADVIAAVCKRAAVKAGQTLSPAEMSDLVRQLEATSSPRTCPHGRPIMIHLSVEQLAKQFGRPVRDGDKGEAGGQ